MWFYVLVLTVACLASAQICTQSMLQKNPDMECTQCPPGYSKKGAKCTECQTGTFSKITNVLSNCLRCRSCDTAGNQLMVNPCKSTNDTECGCKKGYYPITSGSDLRCKSCSSCTNCSECSTCSDTEKCDLCKSDYDKGEEMKCTLCQTKECSRYTVCTTPCPVTSPTINKKLVTTSPNPSISHLPPDNYHVLTMIIVVALVIILLISSLLVLTKNAWRGLCRCLIPDKNLFLPTRDTPGNGQQNSPPTLMINKMEGIPVMPLFYSPTKTEHLVTPLLPNREPRIHRQETYGELWPATVLYAIMKEVPLRRWKEFLRLLSMSDRQLERVELEPGLSSMERQYQMLRLWSQGPAARMEDVYSALRYMDLGGCAQQLQESLVQLQHRSQEPQQMTLP
uniref:Tumor necrosis factor receptor superfamily member 1A-like n=2 Tax=Esox lucius TaxID=8010 RepID=A0AAY5KDR6_ESOLU